MAKEAFAVTQIKVAQDEYLQPGEKVDLSKLTKQQVQQLFDAGALDVRDGKEDKQEKSGPDTSVEKSEPAKATKAQGSSAEK